MPLRRPAPGSIGFTLAEVLVATGVIALLAAVLLPVVARAKEAAKKASCLSGLKQWSLALNMYSADWAAYPHNSHHSVIPPEQRPFVHRRTTARAYRWEQMLRPYVEHQGILACPAADFELGWPHNNSWHIGYNWQYLGNGRLIPSGRGTVAEPQVAVPSQTLAFADSRGLVRFLRTADYGKNGYAVDPPKPNPEYGLFYGGTADPGDRADIAPRHLGGLNVGFVDGHAKWYRRETLDADNSLWNGRGAPEP